MKRIVIVAICTFAGISTLFAQPAPPATNPAAEAMYQKIIGIKLPPMDQAKLNDEAYVTNYNAQREAAQKQIMELSKQFYDLHPQHPQAIKLMLPRWSLMGQTGQGKMVIAETEKALAGNPGEQARVDMLFARAMARVNLAQMSLSSNAGMVARFLAAQSAASLNAQASAASEEFIKAAPEDDRGGQLLFLIAQCEDDSAARKMIYKRIVNQYPASVSATVAKGILLQSEGIGKPFDLAFNDAISGRKIDLQRDLKGKVVVIDFWATWCGPCVGEMPELKETYAKYKDRGVEFIGVSLDEPEADGGLTKLKAFIKENSIAWPQYYQGNVWEGEFSKSWGITSVPINFVVDANGILYSVEARGKLDRMIPKLIARRDAKK